MKQNCDLCKVSSTSVSPPPQPPSIMKAMGKTKVVLDDHHQHHHHLRMENKKSAKYLSSSTKHYCSSAESPPLKPVGAPAASVAAVAAPPTSMVRTIPASQQTAAEVTADQQHQTPYHHLHHHQFNGYDEYYSAPLLSPALMMDMMLAAHLLRGYYQPAGPLISGHPTGQQPQSPLKSKSDPSGIQQQAGAPGQPPPHQVHQPTPSVGLVEHHRLEADPGAAAASDLHRSQAFRYIPPPTGPYARPPIHQIHCAYPPAYYTYGQPPPELCYPPSYPPYYAQKMYATPPPPPPPPSAYRRYMSGSYYQGGDMYDPVQSSSRLLAPPPQQPSGHPPTLEQYPYYSTPYGYGRAMQSYLEGAPPPGSVGGAGGAGLPTPMPYPTSCPCPLQSCPKNVHTGPLIGSSKGPGQPQQHQQQLPTQAGPGNVTCKTEGETENYPKQNTVHYEPTVTQQSVSQQSYGATAPSYTVNTALEPEMSTSPARGSTGLSMPTTPVSPSVSEISGSSGSGGGGRKARIGKNSVREQQLLMSNGSMNQSPGATTLENMYAQELPPHMQHYHHGMMYNTNLYAHGPHYDQRYGPGGHPTYMGHIHHVPQQQPPPPPPQQQQQQQQQQQIPAAPPVQQDKEGESYVNTTSVKQEPIIKTERLEVKQELVSGDDEEASSVVNSRTVAKGAAVVGVPSMDKRTERSRDRGLCDSASVTKPNRKGEQPEQKSSDKEKQQQLVDQCHRASDKTNAGDGKEPEVGDVCDITSSSNERKDDDRDASSSSSEIPVRSGASSLLRLSASGSAEKGPKKSNYKKLIRPAEPKPYLSCALSGAMKRADKLRKKFGGCGDRSRLRLSRKRRRRHQPQLSAAGKAMRRTTSAAAGPVKLKRVKVSSKSKRMMKRAKKTDHVALVNNESTSSEESVPVEEEEKDVSQDKNNNNTNKELNNNNVLVSTIVTEGEDEGQRSNTTSNLDATIDLVARGHFEIPNLDEIEEAIDVTEDDVDLAPSTKRQKVDATVEPVPSKSKSSKSAKTVKPATATTTTTPTKSEKRKIEFVEVEEKEVKAPEKPKSKAKMVAKKSNKTGKKDKVLTSDRESAKTDVEAKAEEEEENESLGGQTEGVVVANTSVPDRVVVVEREAEKEAMVEGGQSIRKEKHQHQKEEERKRKTDQLTEKAPDSESSNQSEESLNTKVLEKAASLVSVSSEDVRPFKGRPGRKPKKGGLKLSSRKRKHQQRLSRALEEVPIKKHVGVPRWSNGWNWLGESFQGLVFLNSDDPPVMRTCYAAMRHMEGDIIRPRDCVLLRAGSKRNELPYVAKVAHLWENPEDGEMMMSLLWYYRPEHTEQGRQEADGGEEVFASKHKDHNSVACIEDKCYVLTFNEYCRYRRILKSVEENIDVPPSIVPALKPDQEGMLAPKVPLNTSPELVMFCYRVYEFRFKRMKNFY